MKRGHFIPATGAYISVHWGATDASPAYRIPKTALQLVKKGAHLDLASLGLDEHSLQAMTARYSSVGNEVVASRKQVDDLVGLWSMITSHPGLWETSLYGEDRENAELFVTEAARY